MLFCNGFLGKFVSSPVFQGAVPRIAAALALAAAFSCGGP